MALSPKSRSWMLGVSLAATLAAAFAPTESAERDSPGPTSAAVPARTAAENQDTAADAPVIAISRPETAEPASDPFSTSSWLPPPPLPPPAGPSVRPEPPVLPYAYLGRMEDGGKTIVLLGQADNSYAVRVGDVVGSAWRVERITDQTIDFIYMPLDARKSLPTGRDS